MKNSRRKVRNCLHKGIVYERKSVAFLQGQGFTCTRSAKSNGAFDVIAIGPDDVRLVQVKFGRAPGRKEVNKLLSFKCPAICRKQVHVWRPGSNAPEVATVDGGN